jgi:hypothetical protein
MNYIMIKKKKSRKVRKRINKEYLFDKEKYNGIYCEMFCYRETKVNFVS